MIIKIDFSNEHIQYISVSTKIGRKIDRIVDRFLCAHTTSYVVSDMTEDDWTAFKESNAQGAGSWDAKDFVHWLNHQYKSPKAKFLGETTKKRAKKEIYF